MTKLQFDNYKFSANTEVKVGKVWLKVLAVDFEERTMDVEVLGKWATSYRHIEDIRN